MNINSVVLRQLARLGIESVNKLKALEIMDETNNNRPFRMSFNQNGMIEVCIGQDVKLLDCNTDFRCICRTITVDSEYFCEIKCVTVYVNKNDGQDNLITVTTTEYAKNLFKDDIEKIVNNLKTIESENTSVDRFDVEYKKNIIILEDRDKGVAYRLDHMIQTILDLK